jgi:tyrosinase
MGIARQDVATLGPVWNKTLLNYALAMRKLDELPLSNRNSWKFLGAVHGFNRQLWVGLGLMGANEPVPTDLTNNTYGNQCQHGSWFFLSWHRGYLFTFEKIVAAKVKEINGDDWALPYWNYLDDTNPNPRRVPQAFLEDFLPNGIPDVPDGTRNPLKKYPRRPGLTVLQPGPDELTLTAMEEDDFLVGSNGTLGLGGGISSNFIQFGNSAGDLEADPHNTVHRLIGGNNGFMGDPRLAGLDPIFWLHHCNIDRLWEAWMNTPGKNMVQDPRWLNGPANRTFIMPQLGGAEPGMTFKGKETLRGGRLQPTYDNLTKGTGVTPGAVVVARVGMGPPDQQKVEPIGANAAVVNVGGTPVRTQVDLEPGATAAGVVAMGATQPGKEISRFYLSLESVRGQAPAPLLEVYVNVPAGDDPKAHPELRAGSLTLFGLNVASEPDGSHGGNGLGYTLDITELAKRLEKEGKFDPNRLSVTLVPGEQIDDNQPITVDKIVVLKRSGTVK